MSLNEFENALGELDFLFNPFPFLESSDDLTGFAGQARWEYPIATNELVETDTPNTDSASSPLFTPLEKQMEYPSPTQASEPIKPYSVKFHGDDQIIGDMDQAASPRHVSWEPIADFVDSPQVNMKKSKGSFQSGPITNSPTLRAAPVLKNRGYKAPQLKPAPNGYRPSPANSATVNPSVLEIPKYLVIIPSNLSYSEDPESLALSPANSPESEDPESLALSPANSPISCKPRLVTSRVRSQKAPWANTDRAPRLGEVVGYDPAAHYQDLTKPAASWDVFKYNKYGELTPGRVYSASELRRYFFEHPLHETSRGHNPKIGGLILWIQQNPFDTLHRCGNPNAARCRFLMCSGNQNIIGVGAIRVTFDEHSHEPKHNPYHNAGYVHLFCLERFMDFPDICSKLDVRAEDRVLPLEPHGKNLMLLETCQESTHIQKFIDSCRKGGPPHDYPHYQASERSFEGTLLHRITSEKEAANWVLQQKLTPKEKRAYNNAKNSVNLELETRIRERSQMKRARKRASLKVVEELSEDDEEVVQDEKDQSQLRRWAVKDDKKNTTREKDARGKADSSWANTYLEANTLPNSKSKPTKEKSVSKPLSKPKGRTPKNANGSSRRTKSQVSQSQNKRRVTTRKATTYEVSEESEESEEGEESEEREEDSVLKNSKRRPFPNKGGKGSEENLQLRRSKRVKHATS